MEQFAPRYTFRQGYSREAGVSASGSLSSANYTTLPLFRSEAKEVSLPLVDR